MQKISLDGIYKLKKLRYGEDIGFVFQDNFYPAGWLDAKVPEDVRETLQRYGLIDGYYLGKNLDAERWIEKSDWLYVKDFYCGKDLQGKENTLCFEGIDTLAEIWLNGKLAGKTDNMFLEQKIDVSDLLRYGAYNLLAVRVLSPVESLKDRDKDGIYPEEDTDRMLLRKSQMNWGWDFCGHCLTGGIWKSVFLRSRDRASWKKVHFETLEIEKNKAVLLADLEVDPYGNGRLEADISLFLRGDLKVHMRAGLNRDAKLEIPVSNPALWWPRPYGKPDLYEVKVVLYEDGQEADRKEFRFGIRTIRLNQEKQESGGHNFFFEVNGKRIFVRGANWVPLDCVYSRIHPEDYDFYIERAIESNLSMLRVWGGGIYESEHFFDLCDENGIMVFQDFMLACGIYPQNDEFLQKIGKEVKEIADRYYNRASLVLWSADNELDQAYWWYGLESHFKENRVNRIGVKAALEEADRTRPFLVSSPCSPFEKEEGGDDPNSFLQGDMHIYLTRFVRESEYYYRKLLEFEPRFMSEYGFSSLPSEDTYRRFNYFEKELDFARNPWLGELPWLKELAEKGNMQDTIYMTQFTHAQALKYWIEYLRSCKWICGGSLYWKFNDPIAPNREENMLFPTLMSVIDFARNPKLAYYYAKRAYEDVILAFREKTGGLAVYGCNETENAYKGVLTIRLMDFDGRIFYEKKKKTCIQADCSEELFMLEEELLKSADPESSYVYAAFEPDERADGIFRLENRFMLLEIGEWNRVKLPEASLSVDMEKIDGKNYEVKISAGKYAQDVMLTVQDTDAFYSDNGFCMDAGNVKNVHIRFAKETGCGKRLLIRTANAEDQVILLE